MSHNDFNQIQSCDLEEMTDEQLVALSKTSKNELAIEVLIARYKNFVRSKSRIYFLVGADNEDLIQEATIGLYKAIRDFDEERLVSFKGFADVCIRRQIITAVKTVTRQKHGPLNSYISLDKAVFDEETDVQLIDVLFEKSGDTNPENILIMREDFEIAKKKAKEILSKFENSVLIMYLEGVPYREIAIKLNKSSKSIDNAIQRIKQKLANCIKF